MVYAHTYSAISLSQQKQYITYGVRYLYLCMYMHVHEMSFIFASLLGLRFRLTARLVAS